MLADQDRALGPVSYDVICEDIVDLRTVDARSEHAVRFGDMACRWFALLADAKEPPSWEIARRLCSEGKAGILVPTNQGNGPRAFPQTARTICSGFTGVALNSAP